MVKSFDGPYFRVKFNEGAKREAVLVNEVFERGFQTRPYTVGQTVEDKILKAGEKIYIVEYESPDYFGGFASKYQVKSIEEMRDVLAIKKAWKDDAKKASCS